MSASMPVSSPTQIRPRIGHFPSLPKKPCLMGICLLAVCTGLHAQEQAPLFLSFEAPGSTATYPQSINDLMVVTGYYITKWGATRGFVRDADGTLTTFAVPGAQSTQPVSINHAGDITGSYQLPPPSVYQGSFYGAVPQGFVRAADGTITTFGNTSNGYGDTHELWVYPLAINNAGEVVGNENDGPGSAGFTRSAFGTVEKFPPGGSVPDDLESVTGLNASGAIIGFITQGFISEQGFLWKGNGVPAFPISQTATPIIVGGSVWTTPTAINAEGTIVGCYQKLNYLLYFMRDQEGVITTLDIPGSRECNLTINDAGTTMGTYLNAANVPVTFIKPLHGELIPFQYPGAASTTPTSLNNLDMVTGYYTKGTTTQGFLLIPGNQEHLD
jgi:hypothetical protein